MTIKYSDLICKWLKAMGYTHCFYLAGGNIMHLLESASRYFTCIPTVHEVAAGVAAEYMNESSHRYRAFVLVTAGPGITNVMTAIAGAFLESRELLVIGGQVKTSDLSHGKLRQRGIQEIDGVAITAPICKYSVRIDSPISYTQLEQCVALSSSGRKGPVFIEVPLDVQGANVEENQIFKGSDQQIATELSTLSDLKHASDTQISDVAKWVREASRPVLLIGAGVDRSISSELVELLEGQNIPVMTTYNGADRLGSEHPLYFGRPNTWGMRYSNILLQQSDLLIAVGTRLGMQQTGFNWREFLAGGKIIQIDCDAAELDKGHPAIEKGICVDANDFIVRLLASDLGMHQEWLDYCQMVKRELPLIEGCNNTGEGFISPYVFHEKLSNLCTGDDVFIPCSSGGAFTVTYQSFLQKQGQVMISNKSLASMGYGLSGAIGAALAHPTRRTILVEGDGGFAQNLQEIGTAAINKLNLKIFIFDDHGYASIRMTQSNYFHGKYLGCDIETGLGLPDWQKLFSVYGVPAMRLDVDYERDAEFLALFNSDRIAAFIVPIDPKQTYFPKISSRVTKSGSMESNPLHLLSPDLPDEVMARVGKFLK